MYSDIRDLLTGTAFISFESYWARGEENTDNSWKGDNLNIRTLCPYRAEECLNIAKIILWQLWPTMN